MVTRVLSTPGLNSLMSYGLSFVTSRLFVRNSSTVSRILTRGYFLCLVGWNGLLEWWCYEKAHGLDLQIVKDQEGYDTILV